MNKVTLANIINAATGVAEDKEKGINAEKSSFQVLLSANLPVKFSYKIKRLGDKLEPILKAYNEKRNELIVEYGEKQEDGTVLVKDLEKQKLFFSKIKELLDTEEDLDFEKIKTSDVEDVIIPAKDLIDFIFT